MNRRQYYPPRNAFPGLLPPSYLSAPPLSFYPHQYPVAPMSTAPLIAQHDFCPMCVRMPVMSPYQQCPQYMYYSGMPMTAPDLCRILPGAGFMPAAPNAMAYPPNIQVPPGMPLLRPTGGLPPDPGCSQVFGASRLSGNRFANNNNIPDPGSNEYTQGEDVRQTTRSRSSVRGRGNRTQNRTKTSNFSQSRNTLLAASKIRQRHSMYRKTAANRSKPQDKDHVKTGSRTMQSVEPVELSSIVCTEEGQDTDYESWEEVENEDAVVTNASDWLNDTHMVMEAPALTNRHKLAEVNSIKANEGGLPMDYTLINDKTFSYVNYNPEMNGTPEPRRKPADGPNPSDASSQHITSASKALKPTLCIAAASGQDITGTCEMSIRHLTNDEVYYVVRPKATPRAANEASVLRRASKSCQGCDHDPKCVSCCCQVCRSLADGKEVGAADPASQVLQLFGDSEIWDTGDMNNNKSPVVMPAAEPGARRLSAFANISGGSSNENGRLALPQDPNNNNDEPMEKSKEFWWDRSTDIGYREGGQNVEHFLHPTTLGEDELCEAGISGAYIQEVDDFVVVDTAPKVSSAHAIDANNNESGLNNQLNSLMSEDVNVSQDRRKLDVDWNSIRSVVPKEYSTRSYTQEGTAEVYDFDSTLGLVSCPGDDSVGLATSKHSTTSSNENRPISEQDHAIVAFVERPADGGRRSEVESSSTSLTVSLSSSEELPHVVNTSARHVEARRVTTPSSKTRPVSNWGKHDVRLLLIASTGSSSPSSTTTWCPPSASTPSCGTTASVHSHPVVAKAVKNTTSERRHLIHSQKQVKSLPTSPNGRWSHLRARKHRNMTASAECIPAVLQQNQQWNTITETPDRELQIDCQNFNKPSTASRYDRRRTDPPDFWRKPSENRHKTYLLTPASSELLAASPTKNTQASENMDPTTTGPKYVDYVGSAPLIKKTIHQSRASGIPRPKKSNAPQHVHHPKQDERNITEPQTTKSREAVIVGETTRPVLDVNVKSLSPSTASTSATSSHTVTPATTPEFTRLGPTGSKTVVKTKRRSSASSRNKRGARKTIIKAADFPESRSKQSNKLKRAPTPGERNKAKEKFFVPAKRTSGSVRDLGSQQQRSSVSNRVVSGRAPTRRSPRTARSTLSTKHVSSASNAGKTTGKAPPEPEKADASQRAKLRSELARVFAAHESAQRSAVMKPEDSSASPSKSSKTLKPKNTEFTQPTSTENKAHAPLPISASVLDASDVNEVTHGHVHSSIQTIVHKLVKQTTSHHNKPVCSPSLAALREKGLYQFQAEICQTVMGTSTSSVTTIRKRASTAPNSPVNNSTLASSRRSVSLSDVFYDSTVDPSLSVWHSKLQEEQDLSSSFVGFVSQADQNLESSVNRSASADIEPQSMVQRFRDIHGRGSTYVGFSPPTMTPPEKFLSPRKITNEPSLVFADKGKEPLPTGKSFENEDQRSIDDTRSSRVLSEDLENEIRQKVEILLHSVKEDSLQSGRRSSRIAIEEENQQTSGSGRGRKKSLDQSTQTSDLKDLSTSSTAPSSLKLTVPPKKPPRSNSPSNRAGSQELQQVKTPAPTAPPSAASGSPIIPYYPLLTSFSRFSPHRHPHFLSPTLIPVNISQQFYRAPGVVWPGVSTQPQTFEGNVDLSGESQFETSHQDQTQRRASDTGNVQDIAPSVVMLPASGMLPSYYIPPSYPDAPHPKAPAGKKSKPVLRRRRSFPGPISSASVAKARLNRRYGLARNYAALKFAKPLALNQSHPVARPQVVHRRPRFARSSLSDDVVFQSIEQRSGAPVFVTKPKTPLSKTTEGEKTEKLSKNDAEEDEGKKAAEIWLSSGGDTGYTSGATSSGRTTPEAVESRPDRPAQRLDAIPEDSKQQDTTKDLTECLHGDVVDDKHSKGKKGTHFQTIKRIKRFMSAKKVGKHDHTVADSEQFLSRTEHDASEVDDSKLPLRKSKTDTKLPKKSDTAVAHVGKGAAVREIFRKTKKVASERGNNSTLKGAEEFQENAPARIVGRSGSGSIRPPGPRENYDMKLALLKPSFVAVAPSEVKSAEDKQKNVTVGQPAPTAGSALDTSIQRTNTRRSVSTPGIRINSETGDVIDDEKSAHTSQAQHQPMHKILSSTAIDDDSLEEAASQSKTLREGGVSSELQVTGGELNHMGKGRESTVI